MTNWKLQKIQLEQNYIATFDSVPFKIIDFLKNNIKRKKELKFNKNLLGHLKEEYFYENCPNFVEDFLLEKIFEHSILKNYLNSIDILNKNTLIKLDKIWCNFMKKYEFNPVHNHSGIFSFIIFIKIPYKLKDEDAVFPETNKHHLTSRLQFLTSNFNGLLTLTLDVDKSFENKMIIFPSNYYHQVYPFFTSDKERITVSGNIKFFI
jgi:hypothetical protein